VLDRPKVIGQSVWAHRLVVVLPSSYLLRAQEKLGTPCGVPEVSSASLTTTSPSAPPGSLSRASFTDERPPYRPLPPYGWNRSSGGTLWHAGTNKSARARSAKILICQGYHAHSCGQRHGVPITQACTFATRMAAE
jgi:hypothetical protein